MKKNTIKLNEAQLKKIVAESVKRVLKEDIDGDNYFGGGLPDSYFKEDPGFDIDKSDDCDGYVVENFKTNEILGIFHDKQNAIKFCKNKNASFWGFHFKD